MSDPLPAPSFNLTYNIPPTDIGSGYAAGIQQAGQSIGGAITGLLGGVNPKTGEVQQGILGQQRTTDDTLAAMQQTGMLSKEQYDAVAGKSLGAKQQMLGVFTNQWMNDMANQRALALAKGQGAIQIGTEHAKLLDQINMIRSGYATDPKKLLYGANQQNQQNQQNVVQSNQNATPPQNTIAGHVPWQPGSKIVQAKDQTGNTVNAVQTPDGKLIQLNP